MLFSHKNLGAKLRRRRSSSAVPAVASLEARQMLAGNVTAVFTGPDLKLTGDAAANGLRITYNGADVVIHGLNGTKINGSSADFVAAAGTNTLPGDLRVALGKGDDFLDVAHGVNVANNLVVLPGAGNDTTVVRDAVIGGELQVGDFGPGFPLVTPVDDPGNDNVAISNTTANDAVVFTGSGNDVLFTDGLAVTQTMLVSMGSGDDVEIQGSFGGSTLNVGGSYLDSAGSGNDVLFLGLKAGGFSIDLEAGDDLAILNLESTDPTRQTTVNLGTGNDIAYVSAVNVLSLLSLSGSKGNDKIFLTPGSLTPGGVVFQEVESNSPFGKPSFGSLYTASGKRFGAFFNLLGTLP